MRFGRLALDLWMVGVVLSLIALGILAIVWAWVSVLTVTGAAGRARRRPGQLGTLQSQYPERELAEIDEALERIMAEEHGAKSGWGS